jgi:hypothetical protein
MTRDEQEALSRKYSNDVMILLPLYSGAIAIFNNARELCGIIEPPFDEWRIGDIQDLWRPPAVRVAHRPTLEDLGL